MVAQVVNSWNRRKPRSASCVKGQVFFVLQETQRHPRYRQQHEERRSASFSVPSQRSASLQSAHSRSGPPDHPQSSVQVHHTVHLHHRGPQLTDHHCVSYQDIKPMSETDPLLCCSVLSVHIKAVVPTDCKQPTL